VIAQEISNVVRKHSNQLSVNWKSVREFPTLLPGM
jgi:hypothetical protein